MASFYDLAALDLITAETYRRRVVWMATANE